MNLLSIPEYNFNNETEVEQKFIYPLLTHPSFLDIPSKAILPKSALGALSFVEKSSLPRNFIPDYIILFAGLPICVIEAKSPEVAITQAIAEARLYAQLLNQQFPARFNPVSLVAGCNGRELAIGNVDTNNVETFSVTDLVVGSRQLDALKSRYSVKALSTLGERLRSSITRRKYSTPASLLPHQLFLDRIKQNSLAQYLTPLYEMFFRAEDPEKIQLILDRAYVDTAELREYDSILHVMLRQIERSLPDDYRTIQTDRKHEYTLTPEINRYDEDISSRGRMHLIIGSRGAGKSLFISRFFSHLMPENLKDRSAWCVIDFNRAPSSIGSIESYICEKFIESVHNLQFDPHSLEGLNRIFGTEISRLKKGALSLIEDPIERQKLMTTELLKLSSDKQKFAIQLGRHITSNAQRPLIVAFDNVDRRESAQQLHIFQAAQWFRSETSAFALLTLRDVTFERFKNEPPLDAFAQISNFYIRPPRFALVLQKRLRLAIDEGLKQIRVVEQVTGTGLRFKYDKEQLASFLQTIYDALFDGEKQVGRIVDALAEKDVREALGMFARMLASGHFNADRVINIGLGGKNEIKHDLLVKILMRADYRIYSESSGFIRNIFSVPDSYSGNLFLSVEVLGFFAQAGQSRSSRGGAYRKLEELLSDLASMGFDEQEVRESVRALIKNKMLSFDGEDSEEPSDGDLLQITPSGYIHLRSLPYFIEYISSVALHAPFVDKAVASRIAGIWGRASKYSDLNLSHKHEVAAAFADYLAREKNRLSSLNPLFKERSRESEFILHAITSTVNETAPAAGRERQRNILAAKSKQYRKIRANERAR